MTDRELLERAARAIGATEYGGIDDCRPPGVVLLHGRPVEYEGHGEFGHEWNPLEDDGAALRLAVQLLPRITWASSLAGYDGHASATYLDEPGRRAGVIQAFNGDPLSATRRAIVRAAAEMAPDGMPF